jgi:hypothetical protein
MRILPVVTETALVEDCNSREDKLYCAEDPWFNLSNHIIIQK